MPNQPSGASQAGKAVAGPTLEPAGARGTSSASGGSGAPTQAPPGAAAGAGAETAPTQTPPGAAVGAGGRTAPTQRPPAQARAGAKASGSAGAWQDNALVTALWSINQDKNSWMWVDTIGWLKLATNSESGIMALTILASHAKALSRPSSYGTDDSSGQVTQMYVW